MRDIAWAAGLFEGEGSVAISWRDNEDRPMSSRVGRATVALALKMTDKDIVDEFHRIIGMGYVSEATWYAKRGLKPQWRWATRSKSEVSACIDILYPYMGERRSARMDEVRDLFEAKKQRRIELAREHARKVLNRDNAGKARDALGRFA